jgi:hypothetical protein
MASSEIPAYTYNADTYCRGCIVKVLDAEELMLHGDTDPEECLDIVAEARGIDRYDERSFDSGDFPKIVFDYQLEDGERCGACHGVID